MKLVSPPRKMAPSLDIQMKNKSIFTLCTTIRLEELTENDVSFSFKANFYWKSAAYCMVWSLYCSELKCFISSKDKLSLKDAILNMMLFVQIKLILEDFEDSPDQVGPNQRKVLSFNLSEIQKYLEENSNLLVLRKRARKLQATLEGCNPKLLLTYSLADGGKV